jgi:hypothetical protein
MTEIDEIAAAIREASWPARIAVIRTIPERFGTSQHAEVYAAIGAKFYAPDLKPEFGYVHWRGDYELVRVERSYEAAQRLTNGFVDVSEDTLTLAIGSEPKALLTFRLLLGFTRQEFAAASQLISFDGGAKIGIGRIKGLEDGMRAPESVARLCAKVVITAIEGRLFPPSSENVRPRIEKPDTILGWESVQRYAREGVPFAVLLHQRHYGGAFRQILDATGSKRGDVLEDAVEDLFNASSVKFVRTGSDNQQEIERRFGLTVKPAPDFAIYDTRDSLRAILECKNANDGGTARAKASRFRSLRAESMRLGGIPLFGILSGLGWRRTRDALGPVIRDTDGRVFTLTTLSGILAVDPFPQLVAAT